MKGPSLRYDMRVLREFCCDACGRTVQAPAWATSRTCMCSDPPKFMRPLERPKTVSPDVSRFITPLDPADAIEEEDVDEVPYVPHVPIKPPPPARFANRRKLYDDTAPAEEPDFGEGVSADAGDKTTFNENSAVELPQDIASDQPHDARGNSDGDQGRSRQSRRARGGSIGETRSPETQRSSESDISTNSTQAPSSTRNAQSPRLRDSNRTPGGDRPLKNDRHRNDRHGNNPSNHNQRAQRRPHDANRPDDANRPTTPPETRVIPKAAEVVRSDESHTDRDIKFPDDVTPEGTDATPDSGTLQGEGRPRRSRRRGRRGPRPEGGGE